MEYEDTMNDCLPESENEERQTNPGTMKTLLLTILTVWFNVENTCLDFLIQCKHCVCGLVVLWLWCSNKPSVRTCTVARAHSDNLCLFQQLCKSNPEKNTFHSKDMELFYMYV